MAAAPAAGGFGTTAVTAPTGDPIGSLIAGGTQREAAMQPPPGAGATPGAVTAAPIAPPSGSMGGEGGNPKQIYETAYGYLLQQDYGAAESAFEDFLKRFPNDLLQATPSTGSAKASSCGASTSKPPPPSSRATRPTARARRRLTASSSSPCRWIGLAEKKPRAPPMASSTRASRPPRPTLRAAPRASASASPAVERAMTPAVEPIRDDELDGLFGDRHTAP